MNRKVTPAVLKLPAEIDISNAGVTAEQLRSALAPEITLLVADLTATTFCDSSGGLCGLIPACRLEHEAAPAEDK